MLKLDQIVFYLVGGVGALILLALLLVAGVPPLIVALAALAGIPLTIIYARAGRS